MNDWLTFLQGASNAAASNVSGPIDLITWALRKAGVPIDTPVGGSDWMAQKGLTKPAGGAAGLLGEAAGMSAPIAAAAKAPQIASGLLKMSENAAAPRTLNPQLGAIVYHGSPANFDKFDASKIGSGEGAQAYGHGIYVADSKDVAQSYAQSVKSNSEELVKRGAKYGLPEDVASNLTAALQSGKKFDPMLDAARAMVEDPLVSVAQKQAAQRLIDHEIPAYNAWVDWSKPGNLYKVDLPDTAIARMLDWDKPLSEQSSFVAGQLEKAGMYDPLSRMSQGTLWHDISALISDKRGSITKSLKRDQAAAAEEMRKLGIPGIRYLDQMSRGVGQGTRNYVVFPGEENLLKILERNGMAP